MSVTIRTVTLDDAPALVTYASELFAENLPGIFRRETPTLEQEIDFLRTYLDPLNCTAFVAEKDGRIVGLAGFEAFKNAEEVHAGELSISVACDHRGSGIGTALIGAVLEWAPSHGIARVQLHAWANNPESLRLYERLGFEREGVLRGAVRRDGETIDVYVLARLLG